MTTLLSAQHLRCSYGARVVFDDVCLDVPGGRLISLIGPNGSGKSSLLRMLAGLQPAQGGALHASGSRMLIVPSAQPPADLTPWDLAGYGLAVRRKPWEWGLPPLAQARVAAALERCGLSAQAHQPVTTLSAGEIQRAWVAAALAVEADVLLIDEPTTHLDLRYQMDVLRTLRVLTRSGIAVITALHDLTLAARLADEIALLADGSLRSGSAADVMTASGIGRAFGIDVTIHRHPEEGYLICEPV
ncbi:MAG: ABC transporter ATP-binding protein [Candidatus Eremiobacteraeota bacterium]|nr:ABC transporter ATP-binding protein [Candidatus Eremiobacteraeota bacterium]